MLQKYNRTLYFPNNLTYLTLDVNCVKIHCRIYYITYLCVVHLVLLHSFTTNLVVYDGSLAPFARESRRGLV